MQFVNLSEICEVFSGYAFKKFNDLKAGKPVIKIGNIKFDGKIDKINCSYTTEIPLDKFFSKKDDLYIALSGATTGKVGIMDEDGYLINQRVGVIRRINKNVPVNYIKYYLYSLTDKILKDAVGAAQPNISPKDILEYKFPLRTYEEMYEIGFIISSIYEMIDKQKRNIEFLNNIIKSQFIEMFGELKNKASVKDCCKVHSRIGWQSLTKNEHLKEGYSLLVTGTDLIDKKINYDTCVYVTKERYDMDTKIQLKNDDILITKDGTIGKVAIVNNLYMPATLNSGLFVVRPDERFDKHYISYVFKSDFFNDFVESVKTGATIKHLNQEALFKFEIPVPTIEQQNKFANFVQQIDKSKYFGGVGYEIC